MVHRVGLGNHDRISDDYAGAVPPGRHRPTERIEEILRLSTHSFAPSRLPLLELRDSVRLTGLQSTEVQGMERRVSIRERGSIGASGRWSQG